MFKSEENDVLQLARTLSVSEARSFKSLLKAEKTTKESLNLKILLYVRKHP